MHAHADAEVASKLGGLTKSVRAVCLASVPNQCLVRVDEKDFVWSALKRGFLPGVNDMKIDICQLR